MNFPKIVSGECDGLGVVLSYAFVKIISKNILTLDIFDI